MKTKRWGRGDKEINKKVKQKDGLQREGVNRKGEKDARVKGKRESRLTVKGDGD